MLLQLDNISRTYADAHTTVHAVNDVSLQISEGEFVAVQGASGCGKSTLLLTAGGLLRPDSGQVQVDGQDPYAMTNDVRAEFRAQTIGFVFQQFHLVPYLSVLENVLAPAIAVSGSESETRDRALQLIERFGLSDRQRHVPAKLSSGERQRTAMARALLNGPKLILADEPTGNLDHENADTVLGYLADFAADGGAVLLVTHDDRAVACAKRVIHLQDGRIAEPVTSTA
ncbi:MAG: ABC transporter ATP-binding protein [Fuerstiella sp.]|nr:ABC transporter ATP-binding protein [Fuerstiella sp.]MCP4853889.1 ABC transporter ATP-binding protein [Fuerstiella sp.]